MSTDSRVIFHIIAILNGCVGRLHYHRIWPQNQMAAYIIFIQRAFRVVVLKNLSKLTLRFNKGNICLKAFSAVGR